MSGDADTLKVIGLAAAVQILRSEFANDRLDINTLAGNNRVDVDGLQIGAIKLFVDGSFHKRTLFTATKGPYLGPLSFRGSGARPLADRNALGNAEFCRKRAKLARSCARSTGVKPTDPYGLTAFRCQLRRLLNA